MISIDKQDPGKWSGVVARSLFACDAPLYEKEIKKQQVADLLDADVDAWAVSLECHGAGGRDRFSCSRTTSRPRKFPGDCAESVRSSLLPLSDPWTPNT